MPKLFQRIHSLFSEDRAERGRCRRFEGLGFRCHIDDRHGIGLGFLLARLGDGVVNEVLVEAAVADGGGEGDLAGLCLWEGGSDSGQAANGRTGWCCCSQDAVVPDLMDVV